MQYKFDCESVNHARAALLLYAIYKSRSQSSSLNGIETWNRFGNYIRGACLKSSTIAEFVQELCRKSAVQSIKHCYLDTGDPVAIGSRGTLAVSDRLKNYQLSIFENSKILDIFTSESQYVIMLVRERLQREKEVTGIIDEGENYEN